jgi:Na+/phosphate symporter
MILTIAALVMIVGVLMYALSTNAKVSEVGRIMFGVGLLVVLLNAGVALSLLPAQHTIH